MKQKQYSDVRGVSTRCANYQGCALCYGCRNYSSIDPNCAKCMENRKRDICDTNKHQTELIAKMVIREKIKVDEAISFKNGGN